MTFNTCLSSATSRRKSVGVGMTKFSGKQDKTAIELFAEAAIDAINEANLKPKDMQALFMGNALSDFSEGQAHLQGFAADYIGAPHIPANRYENACASSTAAFRDAFVWVASGFYDIVLVGGAETAANTECACGLFSNIEIQYYLVV